jgi:hypothetical protein
MDHLVVQRKDVRVLFVVASAEVAENKADQTLRFIATSRTSPSCQASKTACFPGLRDNVALYY